LKQVYTMMHGQKYIKLFYNILSVTRREKFLMYYIRRMEENCS